MPVQHGHRPPAAAVANAPALVNARPGLDTVNIDFLCEKAELQDLRARFNELLASLRTAGYLTP